MGPPTVYFCEYITHPGAVLLPVGEFWNTLSSGLYVVTGILGYHRACHRDLTIAFKATELALALVGVGSAIFHATETWLGQLCDEFPMTVLGCAYTWCLVHKVYLLDEERCHITLPVIMGVVIWAWVAYVIRGDFRIFVLSFTAQIAFNAFTSFFARDGGILNVTARKAWWAFFFVILIGKAGWEVERYFVRNGLCPASVSHPLFWLHPFWHLCGCIAHAAWMTHAASLKPCGLRKAASSDEDASPTSRVGSKQD